MEQHEHMHKTDRPDSIEVGTPGKAGCVKVYFDARDPEGARKLIETALLLRSQLAQDTNKG